MVQAKGFTPKELPLNMPLLSESSLRSRAYSGISERSAVLSLKRQDFY
jgi:hypothetical protein